MAVNWTDEQLQAIETTDCGVTVPAAAGSGKTAVLIERTVRMLADKNAGCPAEKLLAVTFTKDAASQMKTKLRAALLQKIRQESDPEKRRWLERQREMLSLAKIGTINSFCLELVNAHLDEFDYRSGIKIADEVQAEVILDESISEAMEELRSESPETAELLMDSLTNNNEKELAKHIRKFYRFYLSLPYPEMWISDTEYALNHKDYIKMMACIVISSYEYNIVKMLDMLYRSMLMSDMLINGENVKKVIIDDREQLTEIWQIYEEKDIKKRSYEGFFDALHNVKFKSLRKPSMKNLTQEQQLSQEAIFEEIKSAREEMKELVKKMKADVRSLGRDIYTPMEEASRIFEAICDVTKRVQRISREKKLERSLAEFGDVERMAMDLLIHHSEYGFSRSEIANKIVADKTYRVILIDEFQDVNNLQEAIFCALSDIDRPYRLGRNVFVVGDVKQSIYRFRLSNPKLFLKAVENAENPENEDCTKIRLTRNFRSRKGVIDFVNFVFSKIMSKDLGMLEYSDEEKLVCGAKFFGEGAPQELMLIKDSEEVQQQLKYQSFGIEELCIARRIKEMLDSHAQTCNADSSRDCEPRDFCVLSRSKDACRRVSAALEYVGVRVQGEQTDGYIGSKEVATMLELLKVIDNPMKDMPLAAVMLSPILGFTADETARLRLLCKKDKERPRRLYQVLLAASKTEDADEKEAQKIELYDTVLENKCRNATALISRLRFYSLSMTLETLISKIYDETGFFAVASVFENSKQRRANLRLLTQLAADYEKNSSGSVAGFLRYIETVSASGGDFMQALTDSGGENAVAVKTIHASKGLEYPFVFLCSLEKTFNLTDLKAPILTDEESGVGINYMRHKDMLKMKTVGHKFLEINAKKELLSEEIRLLYVALTRAKERLFVPVFLKKSMKTETKLAKLATEIAAEGGAKSYILSECESFQQWLAAAIMLSDKNAELLTALGVIDLKPQLDSAGGEDNKLDAQWRTYPEENYQENKKSYQPSPAADIGAVSRLCESFEYKYPNEQAISASKRTVTEIVSEIREAENDEEDRMFYPQLGSLDEEAARLTAAQKGTYTHLFMELSNYENAERDVGGELERLVEAGLMSSREASGVYKNAVEKFFGGEFYQRMKSSQEIIREFKFMVRADDAGIAEKYSDYIAADGMLQGICDCIFREGDGYVLVDYKTDGFTDISQLDKYTVQLELYKAALDKILQFPVKACYIYSFRLSKGKELKM